MELETLALAKLTVVKGIPVKVASISREEYNKMYMHDKWQDLIHIELKLDKTIEVNVKGPQ
tara:strand:+ start:22234 stop:22416 length:183 start_codon:yes stop_codon:yes gene_type:complete